MKKLKYLVLHCTDTPAGREVTGEDIRRWHIDGRGWKQVGYRILFHLDGTAEELVANYMDGFVEAWEITNGAAGFNSESEHWAYAGGKGGDTRTVGQLEEMELAVKAFHKQFPEVLIVGHDYLNPAKACPSFDVQAWLNEIGIKQEL